MSTKAAGTMRNDARSPWTAPSAPVANGKSIPPVSAMTMTTLNAVPESCA